MMVYMDGEAFEVDTFENPIRFNRICAIMDDFEYKGKKYMMACEVDKKTSELKDEMFCYQYTIEDGNVSIMDIVDEQEEMEVHEFYMNLLRSAEF